MKKVYLAFILFSLTTNVLLCQKIKIGEVTDYNVSLFDRANNTIYIYGKRNYKKVNLDNFKIDSIPLFIDDKFRYSDFQELFVDSTHYFIHKSGGLVFQNRNDSIVRIDNSFNHLMQSNSSIFEYNKTIHRFGGYGFWSARNFIIFFDENLKEWEVINPENTSLIPEESFSGMHIIIGDEFYIFNSNYNNPINRFENIFNTKLWKYNFTKKTWSLIGETDFVEQTMFQPEIKINNKLLINLSSKIVIIDILNNNISEFEKGPHSHQIYRDFTSIFNNERFYYFTSDNKQNLYIVTATESEMIGKKISSKSFYSNNQKLKTLGISVFVLILIIGFFRLYKKYQKRKNRIQLLENGLLFKKRFVQLDKESNKILRILIKNEFVNSSEILKIIEKEQFSRAHNERLKFQKIEELNFQIKMLLSKDEDLIISRKSSFDRRIREYILINRESFVN